MSNGILMRERPILMNAAMVLATLSGDKTQTRRVVKPQPDSSHDGEPYWNIGGYRAWQQRGVTDVLRMGTNNPIACPYGQVGDRLWVRETWRIGAWDENRPAFAIDYCDGPRKQWIDIPDPDCDGGELFNKLWRQSTDDAINAGLKTDDDGNYKWEPGQSPCRWRPSIHMPRWASRIMLEIVGVRLERLNDISEKDAWAEGCLGFDDDVSGGKSGYTEFAELWQSINGPGSWDLNPWVWAIEFKVVTKKAKEG